MNWRNLILAMLVCSSAWRAAGQCPASEAIPYLEAASSPRPRWCWSTYWGGLFGHSVNVPSADICALVPVRMQVRHSYPDVRIECLAVLTAPDGALHAMRSITGDLNPGYFTDYRSPLPLPVAPADTARAACFAVQLDRREGYGTGRALCRTSVILSDSGAEFSVLASRHVDSAFVAVFRDTLALSGLLPGQRLVGVFSDTAPNAFWLAGASGFLCRATVDSGTLQSHVWNTAAAGNAEFTSVGDGYAGTADGSVYRIVPQGVSPQTAGHGKRLTIIDSTGGAGDSGLVLVRETGGWRRCWSPAAAPVAFGLGRESAGIMLQWLERDWSCHTAVVRDTPTAITVVAPAAIASHVNAAPYLYDGARTDTLRVTLTDADGNHTMPSVTLPGADSTLHLEYLSHWEDSCAYPYYCAKRFSGKLPVRSPSEACSYPSVSLADTTVQCVLSPGSVKVIAACGAGYQCIPVEFLPPCYVTVPCTSIAAWRHGDTLSIASGPDTLRIAYDTNAVRAVIRPAKVMTGFVTRVCPGVRQVRVTAGSDLVCGTLHDLRGRLVAAALMRDGEVVLAAPCAGSFVLRLLARNGSGRTVPVAAP